MKAQRLTQFSPILAYWIMPALIVTMAGCGGGGAVDQPASTEIVSGERTAPPGALLDHIILAAPDLEAGVADFAQSTGLTPVAGGEHPGLGTANALVSLSSHTYLEIIGPSPEATEENLGGRLATLAAPQLIGYALSTTDLGGAAAGLGNAGLEVLGPAAGSRETPDGHTLQWQALAIGGHDFGGYLPFLIDWGNSPHPAMTSPGGVNVRSFKVQHPRGDELAHICRDVLGADLEISTAEAPSLELVIDSSAGQVVYRGEGALEFMDH